jgi:ribulose-5-phosphate 4-epimerase/fuculose-1-phosphate aldolase
MSPAEAQLRSELLDYCHRLHQRGWVANHDGNLSCRLRAGTDPVYADRYLEGGGAR